MEPTPLTSLDPLAPTEGLDGVTGLAEVESLMVRLAVGGRFGRASVMVHEHLSAGGKRTRARLALAAAEALGLSRPKVAGWAAACELLHNATLIHDDIQDGDRLRRDVPTTWVRHGVPQAINAGDILLMLPFLAIGEVEAPPHQRWPLCEAVARAADRAARGQSAEMDLAASGRIGFDDWAWAAEGKTGALLALPVEGAALLAGLDQRTAVRLARPFSALGLVYQMLDDLSDLTWEKGRRRRATDIREGRVTSLVCAWCELHPDGAADLLTTLQGPARGQDDVVEGVIRRFVEGGAVDAVRARVEEAAAAILADDVLRAVPDLHGVAADLLARLHATPAARAPRLAQGAHA